MEAKVFEAGLEFARDIGIHDVILKGDSLVLYNAFCGLSEPPATIAPIVGEVLTSYGSVGRVDFSRVKMQGQRLACLLAKHMLGIGLGWKKIQTLLYDVVFL